MGGARAGTVRALQSYHRSTRKECSGLQTFSVAQFGSRVALDEIQQKVKAAAQALASQVLVAAELRKVKAAASQVLALGRAALTQALALVRRVRNPVGNRHSVRIT
jgi:hypothetical protein